jgi:carboxylate-amine ligase
MDRESRPERFGESPPLSIGVEEELLLVDGRNELAPLAEEVVERLSEQLGKRVSTEIFAEQIELKTGVCADAGQALAELRELRAAVRDAGYPLMGAGLHPTDPLENPQLVSKPRYRIVEKDLGGLLKSPPCGLHVHVGMPDAEAAVRVANAFRLYLPALQALSANSPFWEGVDSGHASARASVVRSYPRFQLPRPFRDYEDFLAVADQLMAAAGVDDYTYIWWDVRPHPNLGTVEVRALDVATDAATSAAVAALIQAIAAIELDRARPVDAPYREALEESYFQAASHGLDAEIVFDDEQPRPAREVVREVLDLTRPRAEEIGGGDAFEELERVLAEGNGADRQRRLHAELGMEGLLEHLVECTR